MSSRPFITIHRAIIVLHDPHADVRQSGCISALKILTAARSILDLIYNVWSTSFDITLLDSFCSVRSGILPAFSPAHGLASFAGLLEHEFLCVFFKLLSMPIVKSKYPLCGQNLTLYSQLLLH